MLGGRPVIEMTVSFVVTDGHGTPIVGSVLDAHVDRIVEYLGRHHHADVADIDVDATLARGEVTFSMLVDAGDRDAALVRVIAVVVPAIREVGGVLHLGQTVDPAGVSSEVWRPRDLALT